jgi:hypothetical protein
VHWLVGQFAAVGLACYALPSPPNPHHAAHTNVGGNYFRDYMAHVLIVFIPIIVVGLVLTFSKGKIVEIFSRPTMIYSALLGWTLFGFFFGLDNTMAWGCMGGENDALSLGYVILKDVPGEDIIYIDFNNVAYSGLSVLLITLGSFLPGRNGVIVLYAELLYWLFKLTIIKGGYVVGIAANPDTDVVLFDSVALTLRFLLIQSRQSFGLARKIYLIPIAFLIMTLKVLFLR